MTNPPDARDGSLKRQIIFWGLILGGLLLAVGSWFLSDNGPGIVGFRDPWLSAFAANVSVVVVLLAPGEWFLGKLRQDVSRVEKDATQAKDDARNATTAADKATAQAAAARAETEALKERVLGLEDIGTRQRADRIGALQDEIDVLLRPIDEPTEETILAALKHAEEERLIPRDGVRCPVPDTENAHWLFSASSSNLKVTLEAPVRNRLTHRSWGYRQTSLEFIEDLTMDLDDKDLFRGVDSTPVVDALQELFPTLAELARAKAHKPAQFRKCLEGQFLEKYQDFYFAKDWIVHSAYFASDSTEGFDDPRVRIPVDRSTLKLLANALPAAFPTISGQAGISHHIVEYVESLYPIQSFDKSSLPIL